MKKYQKYYTMSSSFTCTDVFIETEKGKGIPVKPHNNIIQFDPPVKVLGKSMWACLDESSDNSFAVIFPQFNTISQEKFKKKVMGRIFTKDESQKIDKNIFMCVFGDENGINSIALLVKK